MKLKGKVARACAHFFGNLHASLRTLYVREIRLRPHQARTRLLCHHETYLVCLCVFVYNMHRSQLRGAAKMKKVRAPAVCDSDCTSLPCILQTTHISFVLPMYSYHMYNKLRLVAPTIFTDCRLPPSPYSTSKPEFLISLNTCSRGIRSASRCSTGISLSVNQELCASAPAVFGLR